MGAIKTLKEVESALQKKNEANYVRALDAQGNPILISKEDLAEVVRGLINKYIKVNSWSELDNLKWNNSLRGNIYTISWLSDYSPEKHPSNSGCVEILRFGDNSTIQIFYSGNCKLFFRTFRQPVEGESVWSAWTQI